LTFSNSNGITFGLNASTITASHNGLTTARASNDGVGLNTAQSNVTWTVNSSGISLNAAGYAGTGTTFNGANVSGSITLNSNGLNLSLSAGAGGGGGADGYNILAAGSQTANTTGTILFSNSNNITFGMDNSSVITATVDVPTPVILSSFNQYLNAELVVGQQGQSSLHIQPWIISNLTMDRYVMPVLFSNATNSTGSMSVTYNIGIYTKTGSSISLLASTSNTTGVTYSGTANSTINSGMRMVSFGFSTSLSAGEYWLGILSRTATAGANATLSQWLASRANSNFSGYLGSTTNATYQSQLGLGVYSATLSSLLNSVAFSQINQTQSIAVRPPSVLLRFGTA
jgi:hypothetical protein